MCILTGPKSRPINLTAENYVTPWSIPTQWQPIEDPETLKKLLAYRVMFEPVLEGDEEILRPIMNYTVRMDTLESVIQGLETYTRYKIWVSGVTRFGNGESAVVFGGEL